MALIVSRVVNKEFGDAPEGASRYYVAVGMDYLSEPYYLDDGSKVLGQVMACYRGRQKFRRLEGVSITLILQKREIVDHLYISRNDWDKYFREWGLVHPGYTLVLRLIGIIDEKGVITQKFYQKQDVSV